MNQIRPPMLIFFARSFGKHALELGNEIPKKPIYFLKAPSSMIKSGQAIILPKYSDEIHHEAEVAKKRHARALSGALSLDLGQAAATASFSYKQSVNVWFFY